MNYTCTSETKCRKHAIAEAEMFRIVEAKLNREPPARKSQKHRKPRVYNWSDMNGGYLHDLADSYRPKKENPC